MEAQSPSAPLEEATMSARRSSPPDITMGSDFLPRIISMPDLPVDKEAEGEMDAPCIDPSAPGMWFLSPRVPRKSRLRMAIEPEDLTLIKWTVIFKLQLPEGFWEFNAELGQLINMDRRVFADFLTLLESKGINSLGVKARVDILRLVATLLVLQLLRVKDPETRRFLHSLFSLSKSTQDRPEHWDQVKRAVDWVIWADRQYPCICSRLEFGMSWESCTRQLLGFDSLPPFSPLQHLNLRTASVGN